MPFFVKIIYCTLLKEMKKTAIFCNKTDIRKEI